MPEPHDALPGSPSPGCRLMPRRVFLQLGAGGLVGLSACTSRGVIEQRYDPRRPLAPAETPTPGVLRFFSEPEGRTIEAVVARIIPGDEQDPGAREAGVLTYIDAKLASFDAFPEPTFFSAPFVEVLPAGSDVSADRLAVPEDQLYRYGYQASTTPQQLYRAAVPGLDRYSQGRFGGAFADLEAGQQDTVLELLDRIQQRSESDSSSQSGGDVDANDEQPGTSSGGTDPQEAAAQAAFGDADPGEFFTTVRTDTIAGMFADPMYGGNRGLVGWTLIGFPGPQRAYSPTEMLEGTRRRAQDLEGLPAMNPDRHAEHAPQAIEQAQPGVADG